MRLPLVCVAPVLLLAAAPLGAQAAAGADTMSPVAAPASVGADAARAGPAPRLLDPATLVVLSPDVAPGAGAATDTLQKRRRAVTHSDFYYKRLTVHRWASYGMVPLFAAQYVLGERLIDDRGGSTKGLHSTVAGTLAGVYGLNTVTGAWNWWEDRHVAEGRTRRSVHALAMLVAGAGFIATGATADDLGDDDEEGGGEGARDASTHRNVAIASMGLATAGGVMMWLWKD